MSDLIRREDAIKAIERIFDQCEEIENHLPKDYPDRTGYEMFPDYMIVCEYLKRTAVVIEHRYFIGTALNIVGEPKFGYKYFCGACKKEVIVGDEYCSRCGSKLNWGEIENE